MLWSTDLCYRHAGNVVCAACARIGRFEIGLIEPKSCGGGTRGGELLWGAGLFVFFDRLGADRNDATYHILRVAYSTSKYDSIREAKRE